MTKIRKIDINGEPYCSIDDLVEASNGNEDILEFLDMYKLTTTKGSGNTSPEQQPKEQVELSDFNEKLKKGLNFNPKENK